MSGRHGLAIAWAVGGLLTMLLGGCAATRPETITTVEGPVTNGVIARRLEVLGLLRLTTTSGNIPEAADSHFVEATVEVPVGTAVILPSLTGWGLGYGTAQPNPGAPDARLDWDSEDHHWGLGNVEVSVVRIHPPNTTTQPPTQLADLSIRFFLSDDNHDDPWFGAVNYSLLCLGVPGTELGQWAPLELEPPKMTINPR